MLRSLRSLSSNAGAVAFKIEESPTQENPTQENSEKKVEILWSTLNPFEKKRIAELTINRVLSEQRHDKDIADSKPSFSKQSLPPRQYPDALTR